MITNREIEVAIGTILDRGITTTNGVEKMIDELPTSDDKKSNSAEKTSGDATKSAEKRLAGATKNVGEKMLAEENKSVGIEIIGMAEVMTTEIGATAEEMTEETIEEMIDETTGTVTTDEITEAATSRYVKH